MKTPTARALARDALYQVLDNLVFRICAVLTLLPIAFTFLLSFRQDGIVLLFGLERWSYADLFGIFGARPGVDPRGETLETLIQVVFDQIGGTIGVLFCIAATAFFVPRMVERGTADVLFGKPVSRATLYLSRFLAGLVFVALLSTVLALGMYVGLLLVSGYDDPGILCAALALTYVYGLVHSVSMLCGILTRSSVASLLLTLLFFVLNGTIHLVSTRTEEALLAASPTSAAGPDAAPEEVARAAQAEQGTFLRFMTWLHYVLPKTSDADLLARKLRRAVEVSVWADEGSALRLFQLPAGFELEHGARPAPPQAELASVLGEARLVLRQREPELSATLWRRPARQEESRIAGKTRPREEFTSAAARALAGAVHAETIDDQDLDFASNARGIGDVSGRRLAWDEGERTRVALVFKGGASEGEGSFVFTLWIDGPRGWLGAQDAVPGGPGVPGVISRLDLAFGLEPRASRREDRLAFDADWRHNILFSVGSSLAFAFVVLALGAWRLERMEL